MPYFGAHLSIANGYEAMVKDALAMGADTFAFFTRNPRGGAARALDEADLAAARELMREHHFGPLVAHAPYTLNPASKNPKVRDFADLAFGEDLERLAYLPGSFYNFHPGSHVGSGVDTGIERITELLNRHLREDQTTVVLLETMAGKGTEIGRTFEELRRVIDGVELKSKIGVLLDTCHISDGGYNIRDDYETVWAEFDRVIGLRYLKALHLNDSKNEPGAAKDRHARLGEGTLGWDTFRRIVQDARWHHMPMVLETPTDYEGYKEEIAELRRLTAARDMKHPVIRQIEVPSDDYTASIELRDRVMRRPLGISIKGDNLEQEGKEQPVFGAYIDGNFSGVGLAMPIDAETCRARWITVDENYRGYGVGRALMEAVEQYAREHGHRKMILMSRMTALPFYEKLGYTTTGEPRVPNFSPILHVPMEKLLD